MKRFSVTGGIPQPGESLRKNPLGSYSLPIPFEKIYKLDEMINEGAFGCVYKAVHSSTLKKGHQYAIKVIGRLSDEEDDLVVAEASILRDVCVFPNIMKVIDFYKDDNNLYVVQELAEGGDVFDRLIEKKVYTENDARTLFKVLLTTMRTLHAIKVIHRDLKPENLLLRNKVDDTAILLCDFGFAKYLPKDGSGMWTHCGTPQFIAPEVVNGVEYRQEVDMWGIGCILFMLLGGYQPFDADSEFELYGLIAEGDYGFDKPVWDNVSDEAKKLIDNLFHMDSQKRYTAQKALDSPWMRKCTKEELEANDIVEAIDGIKEYVEKTRPEGSPLHNYGFNNKKAFDDDYWIQKKENAEKNAEDPGSLKKTSSMKSEASSDSSSSSDSSTDANTETDDLDDNPPKSIQPEVEKTIKEEPKIEPPAVTETIVDTADAVITEAVDEKIAEAVDVPVLEEPPEEIPELKKEAVEEDTKAPKKDNEPHDGPSRFDVLKYIDYRKFGTYRRASVVMPEKRIVCDGDSDDDDD